MKQYCRYCSHCIEQDEDIGVCEETNQMVKKTAVRNACKLFEFCEIDAFWADRARNPEDAKYTPRQPKKMQCEGQLSLF